MPDLANILGFALLAFGMVLTPGPNMVYLISRSISQGPNAGMISLGGVILGFCLYMLAAAFGITAIVMAVPFAYDALRIAGAVYLVYLAWQTMKPGGRSPFQVKPLATDSPRKLFMMGLFTNLLNPKIAVMYLSLLPQFIDPQAGSILLQSVVLGATQIAVSFAVNSCIVFAAGGIAGFFALHPLWQKVQRGLMGTVLLVFALKMLAEARR